MNRWLAPPDASRPVIDEWNETGAIVVGRKTFDIARGWGNGYSIDAPIFVVTHEPPEHGEFAGSLPDLENTVQWSGYLL